MRFLQRAATPPVLLVSLGLFVIGVSYFTSGLEARNTVYDQETSRAVSLVSAEIDGYYELNNELPGSLGEVDLDDIEHVDRIEYTSSSFAYELCADFRTNTLDDEPNYYQELPYEDPDYHAKGRECFEFTAGFGGGFGNGFYDFPQQNDFLDYSLDAELEALR